MSKKPQMESTGVRFYEDTAHVDLWYPRSRGIGFVEVGLVDVRAADSVRLSYDFDRDGWRIEQREGIDRGGCIEDGDWVEVAFLRAWALTRDEPGEGEG